MEQNPQMPQNLGRNNPSLSTNNVNLRQAPTENSTEQRKKRSMYTFVQVISVVFLLISFVFVIQGIFVLGPQFGKNEHATATISRFTDDFGAMIDNSTDGWTNLSSGCRVHYSFTVNEDSYDGSIHSSDHCELSIGDPIEIVYAKNNPSDNTLKISWSPYDIYLIVGGILLAFSLIMIIISTVLKSRVPNPNKPQYY